MGISMMRGSKCKGNCETAATPAATVAARLPNPDPKNFTILRSYGAGKWCVVEVRYPVVGHFELGRLRRWLRQKAARLAARPKAVLGVVAEAHRMASDADGLGRVAVANVSLCCVAE